MSKNKVHKKEAVKKVGIQPLGDRVLLEEFDSSGENTTASGIIIPVGVGREDETKKGAVVAVGPGQVVDGKLQKPEVSVGDVVLYSWGDKITVEGKNYVIVGCGNISAIINK